MKHIVKEDEPIEFTKWKNQANDEWKPTYDDLSGNVKRAVYASLKNEQGSLCCYCERELKNNDYHIEHLNPQERNDVDPLDFSNMLCSCQRRLKKGDPLYCGNSKGSWYIENEFVSPLNPDCEERFIFTGDGGIYPANENDVAAKTTIGRLKLDIDKLNNLRRDAIEPFLDEALSEDELKKFVQGYLLDKDSNNGNYNAFYTTIQYLFKQKSLNTIKSV